MGSRYLCSKKSGIYFLNYYNYGIMAVSSACAIQCEEQM